MLAVIATVLTIGVANNAVAAQKTSIAKEGQANTQVARVRGYAAGREYAHRGRPYAGSRHWTNLDPDPAQLTAVGQTVVAGSYMIESLNLSAEANAILRTEGGNAETAALLSIRVLRKIYLASADSALVEAISRLKVSPAVCSMLRGNINSVDFLSRWKNILVRLSGFDG